MNSLDLAEGNVGQFEFVSEGSRKNFKKLEKIIEVY